MQIPSTNGVTADLPPGPQEMYAPYCDVGYCEQAHGCEECGFHTSSDLRLCSAEMSGPTALGEALYDVDPLPDDRVG